MPSNFARPAWPSTMHPVWHQEIFAYFAIPGASVTNAVTEAFNGVTKMANRMGSGYAFAAIRAKILFGRQEPAYTHSYRQEIAITVPDFAPKDDPHVILRQIEQVLTIYHRIEKRMQ